MDDHLEQRERGDLGAAEVVRVVGPGLLLLRSRLHRVVVAVDRVHRVRVGGRRGDVILQLPRLPRDRRRRGGLHRAAVRCGAAASKTLGLGAEDEEERARSRRGLELVGTSRVCLSLVRSALRLYGPRRKRVVPWFAASPQRVEESYCWALWAHQRRVCQHFFAYSHVLFFFPFYFTM